MFERYQFVVMPVSTVQERLTGEFWLDDIFVSADSREGMPVVTANIVGLLRDPGQGLGGLKYFELLIGPDADSGNANKSFRQKECDKPAADKNDEKNFRETSP